MSGLAEDPGFESKFVEPKKGKSEDTGVQDFSVSTNIQTVPDPESQRYPVAIVDAREELEDALDALADMATTQERDEDYASFVRYITNIVETFVDRNTYADVWKKDGLDYRAMFVQSNTKHNRLRQECWFKGPEDVDTTQAFEHIRDGVNYYFFLARRLECEVQPFDWERLRRVQKGLEKDNVRRDDTDET